MTGVGGIVNVGLTCYANATIQAFRHCKGMEDLCKEEKYTSMLKPNCKYNEITKQFADIVQNLSIMNKTSSLRPNGFWHAFSSVVKDSCFEHLASREPHDAHEFLMFLLDSLHESLSRSVTMNITTCSLKSEKQIFHQKSLETWKANFEKQYSPIVHSFFGMFHIQTFCGRCKNITNKWETFNTLKGVIQKGDPVSLLDSIHGELNEESIEDYVCEKCPVRVNAIRKTKIWKLPNNLIVVLKRFTHDGRKIHTPLIPFTKLCLSELFSANSPNKKHSNYTIRSIIDHHGSSHGGHYTAQAKREESKEGGKEESKEGGKEESKEGGKEESKEKWYMFDDQDIYEIDGPKMGDSSYILFLENV